MHRECDLDGEKKVGAHTLLPLGSMWSSLDLHTTEVSFPTEQHPTAQWSCYDSDYLMTKERERERERERETLTLTLTLTS